MSLHTFRFGLGFVLLALAFALQQPARAANEASRPNIVFFLIDDLGYSDCGFNGGGEISTPNIDALAKQGAVLESHYVQPICSPTRAALMTGRYPTRTGVYSVVRPHAKWGLPLKERTLADALKQIGYTTAVVGKWHLGEFDRAYQPTSRGFDRQYGHFFGMIDNYTHMRDGSHDWYRDDRESREEGYSTHLLTSAACRIVREQPRDKPLFLYVPYNAVHTPLQVPEKYLEPYGNLKGPRRQLAGMLAAVDQGIGQIVTALNEAGMSDNTLIIFSSDNGGPKPGVNQPLSGYKGSVMEGGVRGCAFATWPGKIPANQRIAEPVHIIDWYPTLIQLAGGSLEQRLPIDGRDIWPTLTTQAPSPHDAILLARSPERVALRMGDWKLVRETTPGPNARRRANRGATNVAKTALYNLASDIGETTDLKDEHRERFTMMQSKLNEFLKGAVPPGDSSSE